MYVDDIPAPKDCLYGAFIYSTHPHAHVKSINFKSPLASQKVITVITAKDIPSGGENVGSTFLTVLGDDEPLFANPIAEFAGQNIGVVVIFFSIISDYTKIEICFYFTRQAYRVLLLFNSLRLLKHKSMLIWLQSKLLLSIAQKICSHQF